jgi:DNA polymerase
MPAAPTSAAQYLPEERSLPVLREAVQACHGCDLYRNATQAVFGEIESEIDSAKPRQHSAQLMLIGEQPGDREDLEGHPFVGPAGKLLDQALDQAGIPRTQAYVTNAVKHFKWEPRGKRRIHEKPTLREIKACRPWLDAEIAAVHPELIVCLGATAAQSLLGSTFRVTQSRGTLQRPAGLPALLATIHPSAILRARTDEDRHREFAAFLADLQQAAAFLHTK